MTPVVVMAIELLKDFLGKYVERWEGSGGTIEQNYIYFAGPDQFTPRFHLRHFQFLGK